MDCQLIIKDLVSNKQKLVLLLILFFNLLSAKELTHHVLMINQKLRESIIF